MQGCIVDGFYEFFRPFLLSGGESVAPTSRSWVNKTIPNLRMLKANRRRSQEIL